VFVIPIIGVLAILTGLCTNIGGAVIHFLAFAMNVGCMAYYIVYFKSLKGEIKSYQMVVPPLVMGLVAIVDFVLMVDQIRHLVASLRKKKEEKGTYEPVPVEDPDT
jgi:hypothetical protein